MLPLFKVNMSPSAKEAVAKVLDSGYIGQGQKVELFERMLQQIYGVRPLTTSGCTHALDLAYHLAHLSPGSKVISTPMTCTATNSPLLNRYCLIKWADIDPRTGNIDPRSIERLLKDEADIEAVVVVDWAGRQVDTKRISEIVTPYHIPVIEDAAHVFFKHHDKYPPNWYTAYSYGAIKHLTTVTGGSLIAPPEQYERAKLLRWFGLDRTANGLCRCSQDIPEAGYSYNMSDVQAAIGIENAALGIKSVFEARNNAHYYEETFAKLKTVATPPPDPNSSWWLYVVKTPKRDKFIEYMNASGIMASPAHRRNDMHSAMPKSVTPLPGVNYYDAHHCAIPVGWWLSEEDRDLIARTVVEWDKLVSI